MPDNQVTKVDREILPARVQQQQEDAKKQLLARIEKRGITSTEFQTLRDVIFPNVESDTSILMALDYCKARKLDVMKRPVHIVPMWSKKHGRMVDTVWPGISEVRITALRTRLHAGYDKAVFGPTITKTFESKGEKATVTFPEWCQITVYRLGEQGERLPFPGPEVYWLEEYATEKRDSELPNDMWRSRPRGQIEKCAEAAALRRAFPEECSGYTAEEMAGKTIDEGVTVTPHQQATARAQETAKQRSAAEADIEDAVYVEATPTREEKLEAAATVLEESGDDQAAQAVREQVEPKITTEHKNTLLRLGVPRWKPYQVQKHICDTYGLVPATWGRDLTMSQYNEAKAFIESNEPADLSQGSVQQ